MGIKMSHDITLAIMEDVLVGMDDVEIYFDNSGMFPTPMRNTCVLSMMYSLAYSTMDSLVTLSNVNGLFRKLIDSDIGLFLPV
jgi:hypothetical protein